METTALPALGIILFTVVILVLMAIAMKGMARISKNNCRPANHKKKKKGRK